MKHLSLLSQFLAATAVAALTVATPFAIQAHEHPGQTDNPCGICKVAATGAPTLEGGPELPLPRHESRPHTQVARFATSEGARTPAAPRAPPS